MKVRLPRLSRFSLRTLFVVLTLLAIPLAWLAREWHIVREREAVRAWLMKLEDDILEDDAEERLVDRNYLILVDTLELPWHRRFLGEEVIIAWFRYPLNPADRARIFAAFPEAKIEEAPGSPAVQQSTPSPAPPSQQPAKAQPS
jgi:hypothetical protein